MCICNVRKNVMRTGLFTGHIANGRYAISIIATYYIEMKKCFYSAWNRTTATNGNQKTTEPKFPIKSIGGFTFNKTDKRLKKFDRGFIGDFDWQLTWVVLSVVTGSLMKKEHIRGFLRWFCGFLRSNYRWFGLLGLVW